MIDTHCHLAFRDFANRTDEVVESARAAGVRGMITVTTTSSNAPENLALAERYPDVWCTSGVHPLYADEPVDWSVIRRVGKAERCVAWGELGLDRHYAKPPIDLQHAILEQQLAQIESAAGEGLTMPIVLHCRKAVDELLSILRAAPFPRDRYVFHCFTGTPAEARAILDFGAMISFTGVVTFKNAREVADAARLVPADRIMVETDAPFLTPEPVRTRRPNEPQYVPHVARFLAADRGVPTRDFERQLDANAERFFGIDLP